ncbi:hypothetical protein GCM10017562_62630 [Streptomyces roseofulvus]|uniref:hypothetical protein n=1 Tax=Streptomyces roseofulvus TaxID=33902 RepID=UPI0031FDB9EB
MQNWIADEYGRSTVKNTLAVLVRVMEQAVRDGIIPINPALVTGWQRLYKQAEDELLDPQALTPPDREALVELADALVAASYGEYRGWGEVVLFAACTAARIGEVSGSRVGGHRRDFPDDSVSSRIREASVGRVASGVGTGSGPLGCPPR